MPRLNAALTPTTGFNATWYDATRTIRYNVPDGHLVIELSDGTPLYGPVAVASVYAGAGHWCAEQNGVGVLFDGQLVAAGGALAGYCDPIGPDGSLVYKRVRDSFGPWGFLNGADFGGDCKTVTNYGDGRASWIEGPWIFHTNFPCPFAGTPVYNYRLQGSDFLYQSAVTGELVLNGHVIGPAGNYYRPDLAWTGSAWLVVWSDVEGEPTIVSRTMTPAELSACPRVGATPPPHDPAPPPMPPKEPPMSDLPNASETFSAAVHAHPDLLAQLRALADHGDANGWPQEVQDQHAALRGHLLRLAAFPCWQTDHNWGLLKKDDGSHATRDDGARHATDILVYRPSMRLVDVFSDRNPQWSPLDPADTRPAAFWIQPLPEGASDPPPDDPPVVIAVPPVTFALGDAETFRPLYGPENATGTRQPVGFIAESAVEQLEAMLEYADAHMTKDDRP